MNSIQVVEWYKYFYISRNICYFGIWMMFVIVYYKQMHKWLKLYEYSIYQFVEEKKNIGCLCKNIMHIMSYEYIHIYYYLVRSKNTVFNINKCLILLFQTQWIFWILYACITDPKNANEMSFVYVALNLSLKKLTSCIIYHEP